MELANCHRQSNGSGGASPEPRVVAIKCNPGPDAEDRLRRIFTLLLEHAVGESQAAPVDAPPAEDDAEEEE